MKKLSFMALCFSMVLASACSEDSNNPDPSEYPEAAECPECEKCEACEKEECPEQTECPKCEDSKECPEVTCPSCEEECPVCPECKDGDECPVCDSGKIKTQLTACNKNLASTKQELKKQQESNESCSEELETCNEDLSKCKKGSGGSSGKNGNRSTNCNKDLASAKEELQKQKEANETCSSELNNCQNELISASKRTLSKNGSRLKFFAYYGKDGSLMATDRLFDSKLDMNCNIMDFNSYGCRNLIYCVPSDKNASTTLNTYNNYTYCTDTYLSSEHETTIIEIFGNGDKYSESTPETIKSYRDAVYYTNASCTSELKNNFVIDDECKFNSDSILRHSETIQEESDNRMCIDNNFYTGMVQSVKYTYYKPINSSFAILYKKSKNSCYAYTNRAILLEQIDEVKPTLNDAKMNRKTYCKKFCEDLKTEANSSDWVRMELKTIDYE